MSSDKTTVKHALLVSVASRFTSEAYWTPQTPTYHWGLWSESGLVWGLILQFFQYFTLYEDFLMVNYGFVWPIAVQTWQNASIHPCLLVVLQFDYFSIETWYACINHVWARSIYCTVPVLKAMWMLSKQGQLLIFPITEYIKYPAVIIKLVSIVII